MVIQRVKSLLLKPKDGITYFLRLSTTHLKLDSSSNWVGGNTVEVTVWKKSGDSQETQSGISDFRVTVTGNSSGLIVTQRITTFTFTASKSDAKYDVTLYVGGKAVHTDTVSVGRDGAPGSTGRGITSQQTYYLATTLATGVTPSTDPSSWTTSYQQGTPDKPYVWRYTAYYWTTGNPNPTYSDCELVFSYNSGANPNLLEQTNFSSLAAMTKWERYGYDLMSGVTVTPEDYGSVTTGTQAHNAFYDRITKTTSEIHHKEILAQVLWNPSGTIRKLEPSTWYTFSFWAKGDGCTTYIYPSCFDDSSISYVNGVKKDAYALSDDARIDWVFDGYWKRYTFTFKTKSTIGNSEQRLLFRLLPKASASISNSAYICMPKLEVGMQATSYLSSELTLHSGQARSSRWAVNTQYFCGAPDERYDDTVLQGDAGFYHCIKSHISTEDTKPGIGAYWTTYWEVGSKIDNLATDIFLASKAIVNNLIASLIKTGFEGTPHIEAEGSMLRFYGLGEYPAIELAVEQWSTTDGGDGKMHAVLRFYNEYTNEFLYDLGPNGIMRNFSEVADSYTEYAYHRLANATRVSEVMNISDSDCTTFYRFNEGYKQITSGTTTTRQYHISGGTSPSAKNACYFTSQNYDGGMIPDGWYVQSNNGSYREARTVGTKTVYCMTLFHFVSGKLNETALLFFSSWTIAVINRATKSVGTDEQGHELSTTTYSNLYSYYLS